MNNQENKFSKFVGMCFNWKGIVAVAVLAAALFIFFPAQAWAMAPFLLFALCPLSMLFMMGSMKKKDTESEK